jgi:hypothetical protein
MCVKMAQLQVSETSKIVSPIHNWVQQWSFMQNLS